MCIRAAPRSRKRCGKACCEVFELCDLVCGSLSERLQQQIQVIRALTPQR
jgi:hypothetical protein